MNGVHDMGGMHGFGPVVREEREPVFHESWEGRVLGIHRALRTRGISRSRYDIEKLEPELYLRASYYERWLEALARLLVERGILSAEEVLDRTAYYTRQPDADVPRREDPSAAAAVRASLSAAPALREETADVPRFRVGDAVRARNIHPRGHTRLPRYVRGKRGVIADYYGVQRCPDTDQPTGPPRPQPLYSVRFTMEELWGASAEAGAHLYVDLWESYLEPVGPERTRGGI